MDLSTLWLPLRSRCVFSQGFDAHDMRSKKKAYLWIAFIRRYSCVISSYRKRIILFNIAVKCLSSITSTYDITYIPRNCRLNLGAKVWQSESGGLFNMWQFLGENDRFTAQLCYETRDNFIELDSANGMYI